MKMEPSAAQVAKSDVLDLDVETPFNGEAHGSRVMTEDD
jgi:hypothetical protein